jgi:hypothetical protein
MWYGLMLVGGAIAVVVAINRRVGRRIREVDDYFEREHRDPLAFQWNGPL